MSADEEENVVLVAPRDSVVKAHRFTPDMSTAWLIKYGLRHKGKNQDGADYFEIDGRDDYVFYGYWILTDSAGNVRAIPSGNILDYRKVDDENDGVVS